jgi:anti-anti-sigma regulatory factor
MIAAIRSSHEYRVALPLRSSAEGSDAKAFGRELVEAVERGMRHVVVDCTEWRELDLGLLSALVRTADFFRSQGAKLELTNLSATITADIRALRLQSRLPIN